MNATYVRLMSRPQKWHNFTRLLYLMIRRSASTWNACDLEEDLLLGRLHDPVIAFIRFANHAIQSPRRCDRCRLVWRNLIAALEQHEAVRAACGDSWRFVLAEKEGQ